MSVFRHDALLYAGMDGFLEGTVPFLRDAVTAGDPTLVAVDAAKIAALRRALGPTEAERVIFADMAEVGANPARIIPAWQAFVEHHAQAGRPLRGIGEPIWAGRTPAELVECQRHEALLNLAFAGAGDFRLLCPYDTDALPPAVIEKAHHSHPVVVERGDARPSATYEEVAAVARPFGEPLPEPPASALALAFDTGMLEALRAFVAARAAEAQLDEDRRSDLVLAVNELATNSVRHAGGQGVLRLWRADSALICEVADRGAILEPLAGRRRPAAGQIGGHGLWVVNQLCDLVQVRAFAHGGAVRVHMRL
jgi:anti-sigma regulatory factor (Ser/Thr protein kinase)